MGIMSELFTITKGGRGGRWGDAAVVQPQAHYADVQPTEAWSDPTQQEQAAFEKAIDDNPLDSTTHGAYADWLQEHGHHDEAAFRRAMADWVNIAGRREDSINARIMKPIIKGWDGTWLTVRHYDPESRTIVSTPNATPHGVSPEYFQTTNSRRTGDPDHVAKPSVSGGNVYGEGSVISMYHWPHYRGMEEAFHRAFMANLQSQREQQPNDVQPS